MRPLRLLLPAAFLAASLFAVAYDPPLVSGAPADPVITAVDQPSLDAMTSPSALPAAPEVAQVNAEIAVSRVLAIETISPQDTVITAFLLLSPARPRPTLARAVEPAELNPNDDGVPIAVKTWRGARGPRRLTC